MTTLMNTFNERSQVYVLRFKYTNKNLHEGNLVSFKRTDNKFSFLYIGSNRGSHITTNPLVSGIVPNYCIPLYMVKV